jgi:hypothetical protein
MAVAGSWPTSGGIHAQSDVDRVEVLAEGLPARADERVGHTASSPPAHPRTSRRAAHLGRGPGTHHFGHGVRALRTPDTPRPGLRYGADIARRRGPVKAGCNRPAVARSPLIGDGRWSVNRVSDREQLDFSFTHRPALLTLDVADFLG